MSTASVITTSDPEITELARALQNDPTLIYEYVLNHIDYVPYYGHLKNATLTLLERSGNDFDQAELLISLLRAAGHTAVFVFGDMFIPTMGTPNQQDVEHWFDVSANATTIATVMGSGGIPGSVNASTTQISRVWVRATTGTGTYDLDPAFKIYDRIPGVDLRSAMGYSRAAILAAAGGTTGTDYVQNINEAGIRSQLVTYANSLSSYLKVNHANSSRIDVVGGKILRTNNVTALPSSLPFTRIENGTWTEIPAQYIHTVRIKIGGLDQTLDIPDVAGKRLSLLVGKVFSTSGPPTHPAITETVDYGFLNPGDIVDAVVFTYNNTKAFDTCVSIFFLGGDDGGGTYSIISGSGFFTVPPGGSQQVTVRFDSTGQPNGTKQATLAMVGDGCGVGPLPVIDGVYLTGQIGSPEYELLLEDSSLAKVSAPTGGNGSANLTLTVDHKYANATFGDQTSIYTVKEGSSYIIISDFGGSQEGLLLKQRQEKLEQYKADGFANTSREVFTETLNVMGQTWMRQTTVVDNLLGEITGTHVTHHHRFGLLAQESGYYIDVKTQFISAIARNPSVNQAKAFAKIFSFIASALEHGVLEQLQGIAFPAVSTIKLLKIANSNGTRIYRADSSNFSTIQSQLSGYSAADITSLQSEVNNTQLPTTLILPANGQIALQQWRGKGYVSYGDSGSSFSIGMIIGGGYFGGFGGIPAIVQSTPVFNNYIPKLNPVLEIPRVTSIDPVDLHTGAYLYKNTDLAIGGTESRGLEFTRFYDSNRGNQKSTLGHGWTHNYDIFLTIHSDVGLGLGLRQPKDAVAMLAAFTVGIDLLSGGAVLAKGWVTAALVAQWATDELFENAVSVHKENQSLTYIKQPDGSFASPPGVTTSLVKGGSGLFSLQERFDKVINFNASEKISSWRDADGNTITYTYNSYTDELLGVGDDYGHALTFAYSSGILTSVTDSSGRTVRFTYDTNNDLKTNTDTDNKIWRYSYLGHRMTSLQDPLLTTIATNTYDNLGRVQTQAVPRDSGTATFNFYFSDFRNIEEDPNNGQTVYFFDKKGRKVAVQDALGNTARTEYDGQNQAIKQIDPRGNESQFIYDGNNNLRFTINALTQQTENIYDSQYRLTDVINPLTNTTQFEYDAEHHLTLTRDAVSNEFTATYYPNGQALTSTDGRNTATTFTYDSFGNLDTTKVAAHPIIDYSYDAIGLLTSLTDQDGATTSFIYDGRGLVTEITDPLLKKTSFVYDAIGRLDTLTDRNLKLTDFGYTPSGKLGSLTYPDATSVQYGYDSQDRLTSMSDPLGTTSNTYDAAGRLISSTDPNGFTVGYGHDAAGNLTSITYPGNKTVSYSYDALNRLTIVSDWLGGMTRYYHDAAGRLMLQVNANGTYTGYGYDDADRLISVANRKGGGTVISSHSFTLDGNGNRIQETREEPIPPSNLPTDNNAFTYNAKKNRLLSVASDTFSYDNEGQQSNKSGTSYSFDYAHRLTSIGANTQYYYDGAGNRLKATRNGQTTKYLYDAQGNLLAEADATNAITRYYIHGAGLLAMVEGANRYTYHYNAVGSTLAMTDSSQNLVNTYSYTPYGQIVNQQENISQPFKYVGQYGVMTEANNLYYMRARYYDPGTGRFISEDPAGLSAGVNLYAYAGGNPVLFSDPSGLCPNCITGIVGAVVNVAVTASFGNASTSDLLIAAATGFAGGFAGPAAAGLVGTSLNAGAKIAVGAIGSGGGNALSQAINTGSVELIPVSIAATGGAFGAAATLPLGGGALEAFSAGVISSQFGLASGAANAIYGNTRNTSQSSNGKRF